MAAEPADVVEVLRERLRRHPADRQPLQHATAQFHLGDVLLKRGALDEAESCYTIAASVFAARGASPEQAKALNGLGATLRAAGRLELAERALGHAAAGLAAAGLALEEGAARCNLGVVLREAGRPGEAAAALERARLLLDPAEVPAQAATAGRELGTTLLALGDLRRAQMVLAEAIELADRAGEPAARGAAANVLGLVALAEGRVADAAAAFSASAAASPRTVRPETFAIAKANLALAYEQAEEPARARLAARQALAVAASPEAARVHASGVLDRLGSEVSDVRTALELDEPDLRPQLVREELARTAEADDRERAADMRAWMEAVTASALEPAEVAELWLGGLLELPSEALERLVSAAVSVCAAADAEARESFRAAVVRAMVRFHVPQFMRLQEVFATAAEGIGDPGSWR